MTNEILNQVTERVSSIQTELDNLLQFITIQPASNEKTYTREQVQDMIDDALDTIKDDIEGSASSLISDIIDEVVSSVENIKYDADYSSIIDCASSIELNW